MRTPGPGVENEQVIVTADDRLGSDRECELEILIVFWITAIGDPHGRLKPECSMAQYLKDPLTPCKRDCMRKPGAQSRSEDSPGSALIVFQAKAGIHVSHGHRPSPV